MVPCFGEDARRLKQDPQIPQLRLDLDRELRLDAKALGAVAGPFLDAAFRVASVAAHVPFPGGAGGARLGIGATHNPYNEVARNKSAPGGRDLDHRQRLMAEYQMLLSRRGGAVTLQYFAICSANPERQRARQH